MLCCEDQETGARINRLIHSCIFRAISSHPKRTDRCSLGRFAPQRRERTARLEPAPTKAQTGLRSQWTPMRVAMDTPQIHHIPEVGGQKRLINFWCTSLVLSNQENTKKCFPIPSRTTKITLVFDFFLVCVEFPQEPLLLQCHLPGMDSAQHEWWHPRRLRAPARRWTGHRLARHGLHGSGLQQRLRAAFRASGARHVTPVTCARTLGRS